ncbi:RNA-directed DNA polymerase, eukaryota, reverse transcriptase zinc-binding domain protein [Tanacetum coccineum]
MEIQGKLLTHDRMMTWHQGDPLKCSLCKTMPNNHSHLFFECPNSEKVWEKMQSKSNMDWRNSNLQAVVSMLAAKAFRNNINHITNRLIISATVYYIWNERNKRSFQNSSRYVEELIGCIEGNITDMLKSLKVKNYSNVMIVANKWGLK